MNEPINITNEELANRIAAIEQAFEALPRFDGFSEGITNLGRALTEANAKLGQVIGRVNGLEVSRSFSSGQLAGIEKRTNALEAWIERINNADDPSVANPQVAELYKERDRLREKVLELTTANAEVGKLNVHYASENEELKKQLESTEKENNTLGELNVKSVADLEAAQEKLSKFRELAREVANRFESGIGKLARELLK